MIKITELKVCSACQATLPAPMPPVCPSCREVLIKPTNMFYRSPYYLWNQYLAAQEAIPKSVEIIENPETKEKRSNKEELERAIINNLAQWLKECPDTDRIASAEDTFMHVQNIMRSGVPRETKILFLKTCEKIGGLATAALKYHELGGYIDARITTPTSGDGSGDPGKA